VIQDESAAASDRATVMIVDDSIFMVRTLTRLLTKFGCEVVATAENGKEAVATYERLEVKPDVITLDITMPIMNGLEALEKIMALNPLQKVIMCSALGDERTVKRALFLGARHYIIKPPVPERLVEVMQFVLSR
jgi:two-component system chemotaxis response regulator CheY